MGTCAATVAAQACDATISLVAQLLLNGCADACAASILAILSAIAIQIRLWMIVFQSTLMKVKKKTLTRYVKRSQGFLIERRAEPQITRNDVIKIFEKRGTFYQAPSQKFAMEGLFWGPGGKASSRQKQGVWLEPKSKKGFQNCLIWEA